jgi:hypothetical protein
MATDSAEASPLTPQLAGLLADLQSLGLRVQEPLESRRGGAGPADAGMLWVEGVAVTVPVTAPFVAQSPFSLRAEDDEAYGIYRDGERVASAHRTSRPRYYDLTTEDGIPYWQIALLHLDSVASTVIQTCMYWGTDDVCQFCGIELSLQAGRTIPVKRPEHLA